MNVDLCDDANMPCIFGDKIRPPGVKTPNNVNLTGESENRTELSLLDSLSDVKREGV